MEQNSYVAKLLLIARYFKSPTFFTTNLKKKNRIQSKKFIILSGYKLLYMINQWV